PSAHCATAAMAERNLGKSVSEPTKTTDPSGGPIAKCLGQYVPSIDLSTYRTFPSGSRRESQSRLWTLETKTASNPGNSCKTLLRDGKQRVHRSAMSVSR